MRVIFFPLDAIASQKVDREETVETRLVGLLCGENFLTVNFAVKFYREHNKERGLRITEG